MVAMSYGQPERGAPSFLLEHLDNLGEQALAAGAHQAAVQPAPRPKHAAVIFTARTYTPPGQCNTYLGLSTDRAASATR